MTMNIDSDFNPRTFEKVERLFDLLAEIGHHPALKDKLCMHGGTAINLFLLDIPRLSVDIDMSYIGEANREKMLEARPSVEAAIEEVGAFLGYTVTSGKGDHAGRTFRFRYQGQWGHDYVKIDMVYLNRVLLLAPHKMSSPIRPSVGATVFDGLELIGGKVKALYDRTKIRDLYDISNLWMYLDDLIGSGKISEDLSRRTILFYAALSKRFPQPLGNRASSAFTGHENEVTEQLVPMLRKGHDISLNELIVNGDAFVRRFVLPKTANENEFLARFSKADYTPELLFEGSMLQAAKANPEALWKLTNLEKMNNR